MKQILIIVRRNFLFLMMPLFIVFCFAQCQKEDNFIDRDPPTFSKPYQLLLSNEGNFGRGTASLSVLMNNTMGLFINDVFRNTNRRPLGDVAQSISVIGNEIYVTLNASNKIEVLGLLDFKSIATITNPLATRSSPQYITSISDSLAAVSDLYNDAIYILNTTKHKIVDSIHISRSAQQMAKIDNLLFVNMRSQIGIINLSDLQLKATIKYGGIGSSKLIVDKNKNLWIRTSSDLVCISSETKEVLKKISLSNLVSGGMAGRLESNFTQDSLFFNARDKDTRENGIYAVSINDTLAPSNSLFVYDGKVKTLYNIGVSRNHTIYICDALDYSQRGILNEFNQQGEQITEYLTGIIPQYLYIF
ncbi:MAG: YncE family protein [Chitinophagaceae bacterium]